MLNLVFFMDKLIFFAASCALIIFIIFFQIYQTAGDKSVKGKIEKIENDNYKLTVQIKLENSKIISFLVDDDTLIYKNNDKQTNFNNMKVGETVEIKYKQFFFQRQIADIIHVINE
jgi:hypothetical protein